MPHASAAPLSEHALIRMQQRGISPQLVEWTLDFARPRHQLGGESVYVLDKAAQRELRTQFGDQTTKNVKPIRVVEARDGMIVTVMHLTKRVKGF